MSRRERQAVARLAVRLTWEGSRLAAEYLAEAYELIVPAGRRRVRGSGMHRGTDRGWAARSKEGARAC
jgi:hypothetical protein